MVFAWTTAAFAALDMAQSRLKLTGTWNPATLPKVVRREDWIGRSGSFCELVLASAAFVWLLMLRQSPFLLLGPAAALVETAPVWRAAFAPILLLTLGGATLAALNFARPAWTPFRSMARIALHVGSLAVVLLLLRAGEWVVVKPDLADTRNLGHVVDVINVSCQIGLVMAIAMTLVEMAREIRRWRSRRSSTPPSGQSGSARAQVTH